MITDSFSIYVGITVIIFISCIFLLIFAPNSKNFFDKAIYNPELNKFADSDTLLETTVCLNLGDDDMNDNETADELDTYRLLIPYSELEWHKWPDSNTIIGDVSILPIFMMAKINKKNARRFVSLLKFASIPNIMAIYFIKMAPNSSFKKHLGISEFCNKTLRYIYCFNAYCCDETECGIWVNSESKKIAKGDSYIYDSSKEHSIYNNTPDDIIFLIIDFKRPDDIQDGYSDYILDNDTIDKFKQII